MSTLRALALRAVALIGFILMYLAVVQFFDSMTLVNGVVMVVAWLAACGLCFLVDRCQKKAEALEEDE